MGGPSLIPSLLITIGVEILCFQLIFDPWAQERFERSCRENARLYNPLLNTLGRIDQMRETIAVIGILSAPMFVLGYLFMSY